MALWCRSNLSSRYHVDLVGIDLLNLGDFTDAIPSVPLLPNLVPLSQALLNFVTNTLPKPVLIALLYRLTILHLGSRILPTIGADSWERESGGPDEWEDRPTSNLTRLLLTYRQLLYVTCYSQLLCEWTTYIDNISFSINSIVLDHSSLTWWSKCILYMTVARRL